MNRIRVLKGVVNIKSIIENTKLYKKLEENGKATSNAFYEFENSAYKVGQAVTLAYLFNVIVIHNFDINQIKEYITSSIKDDEDLKDCFFETLKNIQ